MSESAKTIRVLDEVTANKIAAGEVVERPASVVKELVENSLDAGASDIKVELEEGGRRLVRVTDNGIGMSAEDAKLSLMRHATSKITSVEDLFSIDTLGFRGEALPSIASVSRLEILTRTAEDECGTRVVCSGGNVTEVSEAAAPVGTAISVEELFFNIPARRKFLKTAQTELGHAAEHINRFALSHPGVAFSLFHNGKTVFRTQGSGRLEDALLEVFGRDAVKAAMPLSAEAGQCSVKGVVSRQDYSKPNRSAQHFYVNGRFVRGKSLYHAIDEAYRGILGQGRFPLIVCFIETDPAMVDVNVHPTKIEVKFEKGWEVHKLIAKAVRDALASAAVTPDGLDVLEKTYRSKPSYHHISESSPPYPAELDLGPFREAQQARKAESEGPAAPVEQTELREDAAVLCQVLNTYIVTETGDSLTLIDQHAAHERILYDKLCNKKGGDCVQGLLAPVTLNLAHRQMLVVESKLEDLRSLGFDIELFGRDTIVVRTIPAVVSEKNAERILMDVIEELTELTVTRRLMLHRDAVLVTSACKMAVKAGDRLSAKEMEILIADLKKTSNPYMCPHGRPTIVEISGKSLEKMFRRI